MEDGVARALGGGEVGIELSGVGAHKRVEQLVSPDGSVLVAPWNSFAEYRGGWGGSGIGSGNHLGGGGARAGDRVQSIGLLGGGLHKDWGIESQKVGWCRKQPLDGGEGGRGGGGEGLL